MSLSAFGGVGCYKFNDILKFADNEGVVFSLITNIITVIPVKHCGKQCRQNR